MGAIAELFAKQPMGYDQSQVDRYVQKLTDEYNSLQNQFTELSVKYERAIRQPSENMEAISKALVEAEVRAIQIVAEAKNEATRIIEGAHTELKKIQQEKTYVTGEIGDILNRLKGIVPVEA